MLPKLLSSWMILSYIMESLCLECSTEQTVLHYMDKASVECLTCFLFFNKSNPIIESSCVANQKIDISFLSSIVAYSQGMSYISSIRILKSTEKPSPSVLSSEKQITYPYIHLLRNLQKLDISDNRISFIDSGFLRIFPELIELHLNNNVITSISENTFSDSIPKLQKLNLSENHIETVHESSFGHLLDLFIIDLSYNKIEHVPSSIFDRQHNLELVLLNHNQLINFDVTFRNFTPLVPSVDLSFNKLSKMNNLGSVLNVSFSNNNLTEITALNSHIMALNLSFNHIKEIEEDFFLNKPNLRVLDLGHNLIESLHTSSFRNLKLLEDIDISFNFLNENVFGARDNWISFFLHLENLKTVSLNGNLWKCSDLKDILHSLKDKSVKIVPGNEHIKANILGIGCIDNANKNASNDMSINNESIIDRIIKHVERYFEINSTALRNISLIAEKMDQLKKYISAIETRVNGIHLQKKIEESRQGNNWSSDLVTEINYLIDFKVSKMGKDIRKEFSSKTQDSKVKKDYLTSSALELIKDKMDTTLSYINNSGTKTSDIILILLFILILGFLIYLWIIFRKKRNPLLSEREEINLVTNC